MRGRRILFLGMTVLLLLSCAVLLLHLNSRAGAPGSTRYVALSGGDLGICTNPGNPCRTLQYAVDAADEGDVIKVAGGVYADLNHRPAPSAYPGTTTITQVVYISKTVSILGGYAPEDWSAADPDTYPTTLDGRGQGRVLFITGNAIAANTLIEGLRLVSGNAAGLGGDPLGYDAGGGIYGFQASATLSDSLILSNTAEAGGGLYSLHSDWILSNNAIEANTAAGRGGGLYLVESFSQMNGNVIRLNEAGEGGGGVLVLAGEAQLANNVIADNSSESEGPGLHIEGALVRALHTTIASNEMPSGDSYTEGSGIYVRADLAGSPATAVFTNTIVASHTLAFNISQSTARFEDTLWYRNGGMIWGDDTTLLKSHGGFPAFADPAAGDYHLLPESAALDIGADTPVHTDIDGEPRPQWCGPDIGVDELAVAGTCHQIYFPLILRGYTTYRPVQGSVEIEGGICCAGGYAGQTITLTVEYTATSPFAPVTEMRTAWWGGCLGESEMSDLEWEPFVLEREYPAQVIINWVGYYATVQYRDALGYISPIYCDDISVEGFPPPVPTGITPTALRPPLALTPAPSGAGKP